MIDVILCTVILPNCPRVESWWQLDWKNNYIIFPKIESLICIITLNTVICLLRSKKLWVLWKEKKPKAQGQSLRGISAWGSSFFRCLLWELLLGCASFSENSVTICEHFKLLVKCKDPHVMCLCLQYYL